MVYPVASTENNLTTNMENIRNDLTRAFGDRTSVYAVWHRVTGPPLSLGMLTSFARHFKDGILLPLYDIRHPEPSDLVLRRLAQDLKPPIVLCSHYVWSTEDNLEFAHNAIRVKPGTIVIHGGPNCPKQLDAAQLFLNQNREAADILVHGEGEDALVEILEAIAGSTERLPRDRLRQVPGISFLDEGGDIVRTPQRSRRSNLDELPSPLLSGEFDGINVSAWRTGLHLETNRGCPYGCTFCDWGSLTASRIRMFALERVKKELTWAAERGFDNLSFCDANFGITKRDVEIIDHLAAEKERTGYPSHLGFAPAKNTVRNLVAIFDRLREAQINLHCNIGLQTTDGENLAVLNRSNISLDAYMELIRELRKRDDYVACDFLLGSPGQTVESFRRDLQFAIDREVPAWVFQTRVLPNSPMNEPAYMKRYGIEVDDQGFICATKSFTSADRQLMLRLLSAYQVGEHLGFFRHILRVIQWESGMECSEILLAIAKLPRERSIEYPNLFSLLDDFLSNPWVPETWAPLYAEVRQLLQKELHVRLGPPIEAAFRAQEAIMPTTDHDFPLIVELSYDYVSYYRSAVAALMDGEATSRPSGSLVDFGPGRLEVSGDPLKLCSSDVRFPSAPQYAHNEDTFFYGSACFELLSDLRSSFASRLFRLACPELTDELDASGIRPTGRSQ